MKRRDFLQNTIAACVGAAALETKANAAEAAAPAGRDLYELRVYTLKTAKKSLLDDYLSKAFIPAVKRLGSGPVGVFSETVDPDHLAVYVLTVHSSAEQIVAQPAKLAADSEYQKAGADYLSATAADPVYERIQSSVHLAIEGMPKLARPDSSKPRLLNLRIYESHNERAAAKKIEMFNLHEMPIFQRVGLTPVFFGQTIVGANMPNLTYMLVFPDDAGRTAAWKRFGGDDEWKKLKAIPEYADKSIVSKITNKILTPEAYSEI
ncbi:NIPSNAP family containing protein [Chthoniobacter flavus Ellin428]|uniref:NIPSNAP family containing protein n=1 Tax=Chthoniobacter flavus Ellin428 TaxID=497964 RepID=B4D5F9_9BACT|nr:NIPSNAP family protein [Chthoniobacter flavus]EDY18364.1 NIPSNAP family containing protein [Chthoniobacter flavus Ellin428]TCO91386.1 NIPSNAP protein [Chthoniobacter flavus]